MFKPVKYNQFRKLRLFDILATDGTAYIAVEDAQGKVTRGILQSIQREDGSGRSFILTITPDHPEAANVTVYVRTVD